MWTVRPVTGDTLLPQSLSKFIIPLMSVLLVYIISVSWLFVDMGVVCQALPDEPFGNQIDGRSLLRLLPLFIKMTIPA